MVSEGSNKIVIEMKTRLLAKKDNPKEFFSELHRIWLEECQQNEKQLSKLIINLNKEDGIDFCQVALDAINDGFRCFDVTPVIEEALPSLDLNISSVIHLTESLFECMKGDIAAYRQLRPFEELIVKKPDFTRKLLEELLKQDKPYIVGYVANIYQRLSEGNEHEIHKELCALKTHNSKYVLMAVAGALGEFDYMPSKNRPLVKNTINLLEELEAINSDEINRLAIFAYKNLVNISKEAKKKLVYFSKTNSLLIQGALSQVLFITLEEHGNEKWFSEVLLNLSTSSCENTGIIDNIDFVLTGLIEKKDNWDLAEEFFKSWLLNSDYRSKNDKLSGLYNSTFIAFVNKRKYLEKLITKLFNHDNTEMHNAASEIVTYCHAHKITALQLDKEVLKSLSVDDCVYICRKILGYVIFPESLCSLCFSVLNKSPKNQKIQDLVYSVFKSHVGKNYPGRTVEFFKEVSTTTKSIIRKNIALKIIHEMESYFAQRDALPQLKELAMPKQKSQRIYLENNKKMSSIMEEAQKNSIVSMISTKIILKNGTGSFNFNNGQYSEISKLSSISTEMDLPHSEISHPVDAALERINFRVAKRGM